jgi:hypothetical protein
MPNPNAEWITTSDTGITAITVTTTASEPAYINETDRFNRVARNRLTDAIVRILEVIRDYRGNGVGFRNDLLKQYFPKTYHTRPGAPPNIPEWLLGLGIHAERLYSNLSNDNRVLVNLSPNRAVILAIALHKVGGDWINDVLPLLEEHIRHEDDAYRLAWFRESADVARAL